MDHDAGGTQDAGMSTSPQGGEVLGQAKGPSSQLSSMQTSKPIRAPDDPCTCDFPCPPTNFKASIENQPPKINDCTCDFQCFGQRHKQEIEIKTKVGSMGCDCRDNCKQKGGCECESVEGFYTQKKRSRTCRRPDILSKEASDHGLLVELTDENTETTEGNKESNNQSTQGNTTQPNSLAANHAEGITPGQQGSSHSQQNATSQTGLSSSQTVSTAQLNSGYIHTQHSGKSAGFPAQMPEGYGQIPRKEVDDPSKSCICTGECICTPQNPHKILVSTQVPVQASGTPVTSTRLPAHGQDKVLSTHISAPSSQVPGPGYSTYPTVSPIRGTHSADTVTRHQFYSSSKNVICLSTQKCTCINCACTSEALREGCIPDNFELKSQSGSIPCECVSCICTPSRIQECCFRGDVETDCIRSNDIFQNADKVTEHYSNQHMIISSSNIAAKMANEGNPPCICGDPCPCTPNEPNMVWVPDNEHTPQISVNTVPPNLYSNTTKGTSPLNSDQCICNLPCPCHPGKPNRVLVGDKFGGGAHVPSVKKSNISGHVSQHSSNIKNLMMVATSKCICHDPCPCSPGNKNMVLVRNAGGEMFPQTTGHSMPEINEHVTGYPASSKHIPLVSAPQDTCTCTESCLCETDNPNMVLVKDAQGDAASPDIRIVHDGSSERRIENAAGEANTQIRETTSKQHSNYSNQVPPHTTQGIPSAIKPCICIDICPCEPGHPHRVLVKDTLSTTPIQTTQSQTPSVHPPAEIRHSPYSTDPFLQATNIPTSTSKTLSDSCFCPNICECTPGKPSQIYTEITAGDQDPTIISPPKQFSAHSKTSISDPIEKITSSNIIKPPEGFSQTNMDEKGSCFCTGECHCSIVHPSSDNKANNLTQSRTGVIDTSGCICPRDCTCTPGNPQSIGINELNNLATYTTTDQNDVQNVYEKTTPAQSHEMQIISLGSQTGHNQSSTQSPSAQYIPPVLVKTPSTQGGFNVCICENVCTCEPGKPNKVLKHDVDIHIAQPTPMLSTFNSEEAFLVKPEEFGVAVNPITNTGQQETIVSPRESITSKISNIPGQPPPYGICKCITTSGKCVCSKSGSACPCDEEYPCTCRQHGWIPPETTSVSVGSPDGKTQRASPATSAAGRITESYSAVPQIYSAHSDARKSPQRSAHSVHSQGDSIPCLCVSCICTPEVIQEGCLPDNIIYGECYNTGTSNAPGDPLSYSGNISKGEIVETDSIPCMCIDCICVPEDIRPGCLPPGVETCIDPQKMQPSSQIPHMNITGSQLSHHSRNTPESQTPCLCAECFCTPDKMQDICGICDECGNTKLIYSHEPSKQSVSSKNIQPSQQNIPCDPQDGYGSINSEDCMCANCKCTPEFIQDGCIPENKNGSVSPYGAVQPHHSQGLPVGTERVRPCVCNDPCPCTPDHPNVVIMSETAIPTAYLDDQIAFHIPSTQMSGVTEPNNQQEKSMHSTSQGLNMLQPSLTAPQQYATQQNQFYPVESNHLSPFQEKQLTRSSEKFTTPNHPSQNQSTHSIRETPKSCVCGNICPCTPQEPNIVMLSETNIPAEYQTNISGPSVTKMYTPTSSKHTFGPTHNVPQNENMPIFEKGSAHLVNAEASMPLASKFSEQTLRSIVSRIQCACHECYCTPEKLLETCVPIDKQAIVKELLDPARSKYPLKNETSENPPNQQIAPVNPTTVGEIPFQAIHSTDANVAENIVKPCVCDTVCPCTPQQPNVVMMSVQDIPAAYPQSEGSNIISSHTPLSSAYPRPQGVIEQNNAQFNLVDSGMTSSLTPITSRNVPGFSNTQSPKVSTHSKQYSSHTPGEDIPIEEPGTRTMDPSINEPCLCPAPCICAPGKSNLVLESDGNALISQQISTCTPDIVTSVTGSIPCMCNDCYCTEENIAKGCLPDYLEIVDQHVATQEASNAASGIKIASRECVGISDHSMKGQLPNVPTIIDERQSKSKQDEGKSKSCICVGDCVCEPNKPSLVEVGITTQVPISSPHSQVPLSHSPIPSIHSQFSVLESSQRTCICVDKCICTPENPSSVVVSDTHGSSVHNKLSDDPANQLPVTQMPAVVDNTTESVPCYCDICTPELIHEGCIPNETYITSQKLTTIPDSTGATHTQLHSKHSGVEASAIPCICEGDCVCTPVNPNIIISGNELELQGPQNISMPLIQEGTQGTSHESITCSQPRSLASHSSVKSPNRIDCTGDACYCTPEQIAPNCISREQSDKTGLESSNVGNVPIGQTQSTHSDKELAPEDISGPALQVDSTTVKKRSLASTLSVKTLRSILSEIECNCDECYCTPEKQTEKCISPEQQAVLEELHRPISSTREKSATSVKSDLGSSEKYPISSTPEKSATSVKSDLGSSEKYPISSTPEKSATSVKSDLGSSEKYPISSTPEKSATSVKSDLGSSEKYPISSTPEKSATSVKSDLEFSQKLSAEPGALGKTDSKKSIPCMCVDCICTPETIKEGCLPEGITIASLYSEIKPDSSVLAKPCTCPHDCSCLPGYPQKTAVPSNITQGIPDTKQASEIQPSVHSKYSSVPAINLAAAAEGLKQKLCVCEEECICAPGKPQKHFTPSGVNSDKQGNLSTARSADHVTPMPVQSIDIPVHSAHVPARPHEIPSVHGPIPVSSSTTPVTRVSGKMCICIDDCICLPGEPARVGHSQTKVHSQIPTSSQNIGSGNKLQMQMGDNLKSDTNICECVSPSGYIRCSETDEPCPCEIQVPCICGDTCDTHCIGQNTISGHLGGGSDESRSFRLCTCANIPCISKANLSTQKIYACSKKYLNTLKDLSSQAVAIVNLTPSINAYDSKECEILNDVAMNSKPQYKTELNRTKMNEIEEMAANHHKEHGNETDSIVHRSIRCDKLKNNKLEQMNVIKKTNFFSPAIYSSELSDLPFTDWHPDAQEIDGSLVGDLQYKTFHSSDELPLDVGNSVTGNGEMRERTD